MTKRELIRLCNATHSNKDTITRTKGGYGYYVCSACANTLRNTKGERVNIFDFIENHNK